MNYVMELLPVLPFAFFAALLLYAVIFMVTRQKRDKPDVLTMLAEFALVGWLVVFIYVTQIKSFGNGMGELYNLQPLHMFYIAFRYGSNNAGMVWQFLLNILMFVPLGLLLPVVLAPQCRTWPRIALISLGFTLITELLQLISLRGTDIDDVIANTLGGLCGFALFLMAYGLIALSKRQRIAIPLFGRKLVCGVGVLCVVAGGFVAVKWADGSSKYGNLYYGHMQPVAVQVDAGVSDQASVRNVYRYTEHIALAELQSRLLAASGFTGQFTANDRRYTLADGDERRIFIYPYNTWCVTYAYGQERDAAATAMLSAADAAALAWHYLESYGITADTIKFQADVSATYRDHDRHLQFVSTESTDRMLVYGSVYVTLGKDGQLVEIQDTRRWCEFVETVECISPRESIAIAQEVGVGEWNGTARVTSVDEGYSFIDETGYLIPTWDIVAAIYFDGGIRYDWDPIVDAVK